MGDRGVLQIRGVHNRRNCRATDNHRIHTCIEWLSLLSEQRQIFLRVIVNLATLSPEVLQGTGQVISSLLVNLWSRIHQLPTPVDPS